MFAINRRVNTQQIFNVNLYSDEQDFIKLNM